MASEPMEDIKRLLVLLKLGSTSEEISLALQVEASGVRKIMPTRNMKKIVKSTEE